MSGGAEDMSTMLFPQVPALSHVAISWGVIPNSLSRQDGGSIHSNYLTSVAILRIWLSAGNELSQVLCIAPRAV